MHFLHATILLHATFISFRIPVRIFFPIEKFNYFKIVKTTSFIFLLARML